MQSQIGDLFFSLHMVVFELLLRWMINLTKGPQICAVNC